MKRLFALYVAVILFAAGTGYASLASALRSDTMSFQWGYYNGDRNWIWVYSGPTTTNCLYALHGNYVTGMAVCATPGHYILRRWIDHCLGFALDRQGQSWVQTGPYNWATNDGRLFASERISGGVDTLFIWYASSPQPTIKQRPKGKPHHKPQELLPPVQES